MLSACQRLGYQQRKWQLDPLCVTSRSLDCWWGPGAINRRLSGRSASIGALLFVASPWRDWRSWADRCAVVSSSSRLGSEQPLLAGCLAFGPANTTKRHVVRPPHSLRVSPPTLRFRFARCNPVSQAERRAHEEWHRRSQALQSRSPVACRASLTRRCSGLATLAAELHFVRLATPTPHEENRTSGTTHEPLSNRERRTRRCFLHCRMFFHEASALGRLAVPPRGS